MAWVLRPFPAFLSGPGAVGLLVVRLVAGTATMFHGRPRSSIAILCIKPNDPMPGILQALAALAEFGGGLCWVLRLLTPVASLLILSAMDVATGMVHIP